MMPSFMTVIAKSCYCPEFTIKRGKKLAINPTNASVALATRSRALNFEEEHSSLSYLSYRPVLFLPGWPGFRIYISIPLQPCFNAA